MPESSYTPADLLAFEEEIAQLFAKGEIRSPVHLGGGNEDALIEIFKTIGPNDWVLGQWRSHFHCLLRGVPRDELKDAILKGRSVALCFPKQKILCSGICGGIAPIAVGLAWSLKKRDDASPTPAGVKVHVFLGDMSSEMGIVHESIRYAVGHELPIRWIVEDNGHSVCTNTQAVWGSGTNWGHISYRYTLSRPHVGIGHWVRF